MDKFERVDSDPKYQKKGFGCYVNTSTGVYSEIFNYVLEDGKKIPVEIFESDNPLNGDDYVYVKYSPNFTKVTIEHFKIMDKLMRKNKTAALIYNFFLFNMDRTNALIMSYRAMEEVFDKSRTTCHRAIEVLVNEKVLEIHTSGNSNVYCINASLAWAKSESDKKYARFNASVVLSEKEATTKYITPRIEPKGTKGISKKGSD